MRKSTRPNKKIVVAKGFMNAREECPHPSYNVIKSGFFNYLICRTCGKNMGEVHIDIEQPNQ